MLLSSMELLMNFTLRLDCKADESLFSIRDMVGLGKPMAVQLKVTLAPISALWFRGTPINLSAAPEKKVHCNKYSLLSLR